MLASVLHERYQKMLADYRPFVVAAPWLRDRMNLEPLGRKVDPENVYSSIHMSSGPFLDLIQHLDSRCYARLGMRMPRWAFYDCGELPGTIVGLGRPAAELAPEIQAVLEVPEGYEGLVPLTMYVAIPMLERDHWLGHTICSIHEVIEGGAPLGSRRLTIALALAALRAKRTTSTTQWGSSKLHAHSHFAPLEVLAAWVPAHDDPATCVVRAEIDEGVLERALQGSVPEPTHSRVIDPTDETALQVLQQDIEGGSRVLIAGRTFRKGDTTRVPLTYEEVSP